MRTELPLLLKKCGQQRLYLELVNVNRRFLVSIGVVEHELVILNVLGDAVHLDLRLMHLNSRIEATYGINLSLYYLLFEKGSFTHTDADVHLVGTDMIECFPDESPLLLYHFIIVEVADFASCLVGCFLFLLLSFELFELSPAVLPLLLKLFNVIYDVARWFCHRLFLLHFN